MNRFLPGVVFWTIHITLTLPALWLLALYGVPVLGLVVYLAWVLLIVFPIAYTIRHRLRLHIQGRELQRRWAKVVADFYRPEAKR